MHIEINSLFFGIQLTIVQAEIGDKVYESSINIIFSTEKNKQIDITSM